MQKIPILWFNDTTKTQNVYFDCFFGENYQGEVKPQSDMMLDYPLPIGKLLFIKQWDNGRVLISSFDNPTRQGTPDKV